MYVLLEVVECIDTFSKIVFTILFYVHEEHCRSAVDVFASLCDALKKNTGYFYIQDIMNIKI